jgi:hypothetical protein
MINLDDEIDIIYDHIDDLMLEGKFKQIDLILSQVSIELDVVLLIGFLCITYLCKEKFKYRAKIIDMIKQKRPGEDDLWLGLE